MLSLTLVCASYSINKVCDSIKMNGKLIEWVLISYYNGKIVEWTHIILWKERLHSDDQQFHLAQQNKHYHLNNSPHMALEIPTSWFGTGTNIWRGCNSIIFPLQYDINTHSISLPFINCKILGNYSKCENIQNCAYINSVIFKQWEVFTILSIKTSNI
jgi:hypothetical protein